VLKIIGFFFYLKSEVKIADLVLIKLTNFASIDQLYNYERKSTFCLQLEIESVRDVILLRKCYYFIEQKRIETLKDMKSNGCIFQMTDWFWIREVLDFNVGFILEVSISQRN